MVRSEVLPESSPEVKYGECRARPSKVCSSRLHFEAHRVPRDLIRNIDKRERIERQVDGQRERLKIAHTTTID